MRVTLTLPPGPEADALVQALGLPDHPLPHIILRRAALRAVGAAPVLMAMQSRGRASYLFHGLVASDAHDIASTVRTYLDAPRGWILDARACGRLRHCLKTRIPAD